ncbi:MAG: hypothetical protein V4606_00920 [Patescibacteria group bacterium]
MGLWWEEVNDKVPFASAVTFSADKSAVSKRVPILWRFMQDWHCLQVMGWHGHGHDGGYRLFFASGLHKMRYRKVLRTRFVMVRVGTEPVSFWVENTKGVAGELIRNGRMVPAHRFRPDRSSEDSSSVSMIKDLGEIAWV